MAVMKRKGGEGPSPSHLGKLRVKEIKYQNFSGAWNLRTLLAS